MILRVENLHKSFGERTLFKGADFVLERGEKMAILGGNGAGKTTLLELIVGLQQPDSLDSVICWERGALFDYLPQEVVSQGSHHSALSEFPARRLALQLQELSEAIASGRSDLLQDYEQLHAALEAAGGYQRIDDFITSAEHLGLCRHQLEQDLSKLSGGERMRAALARILVSDADCLILDEPSNHLDIEGVEWLETFLVETSKTVLFVSHDRHLLDRVATSTLAIERQKLIKYQGNYSDRLRWTSALAHERRIRTAKLAKELAHEREVAATLLSHRKISSYHSRQKRAERLAAELKALQPEAVERERHLNFDLRQKVDQRRSDRVLLLAQDLSVDYGHHLLFTPREFVLQEGQKQIITGPNGCGKTSLLTALCLDLPERVGQVRHSRDLKIAKLDQAVRFPHESRTVLEEFQERFPDYREGQARALLARFAFYDLEVFKALGDLSGGERTRLHLLFNLMAQPDLLVLDEPTNHLDLASKEVLESALVDFPGAILAVSHDRHFMTKLGANIWGFIDREVRDFSSWSAYREALLTHRKKREEQQRGAPEAISPAQSTADKGMAVPIWTSEQLALWPALDELPKDIGRPAELRQYKAKGRLMTEAMLSQLTELEEEAETLSATFGEAKDEGVYHRYADCLRRQEILSELYLSLAGFLEELAR